LTTQTIFTGDDWVSQNVDLWRRTIPNPEDIKTFIEIGNWEGRSTLWWANYCINAKILSIDPSGNLDRRKNLLHNISISDRANSINLRFDLSENVLPFIQKESIDLIYVDGSHEAKDVLLDGLMCWKAIKKGGVIIFDDYGLEEKKGYEKKKPSIGMDALLSVIDCKILNKKWQLIIQK
jgi:predicted O-methyltransferase YrrM